MYSVYSKKFTEKEIIPSLQRKVQLLSREEDLEKGKPFAKQFKNWALCEALLTLCYLLLLSMISAYNRCSPKDRKTKKALGELLYTAWDHTLMTLRPNVLIDEE